eukprot:95095-Karenia_brevis.AAC.1
MEPLHFRMPKSIWFSSISNVHLVVKVMGSTTQRFSSPAVVDVSEIHFFAIFPGMPGPRCSVGVLVDPKSRDVRALDATLTRGSFGIRCHAEEPSS